MSRRISPVIPGFGLTLGYTLVYLSLLVLIPLGAMFLKTTQLSWSNSGPSSARRGCSPRSS